MLTLSLQWVVSGFDPLFGNPVLIAVLAVVFLVVVSYLPWVLLYRFVFGSGSRLASRLNDLVRVALLFGAVCVVSGAVLVASYGGAIRVADVVTPLALNVLNAVAVVLFECSASKVAVE